jgi:hypothetical protein
MPKAATVIAFFASALCVIAPAAAQQTNAAPTTSVSAPTLINDGYS